MTGCLNGASFACYLDALHFTSLHLVAEPRFVTPEHNFGKEPPRFFWMDKASLEDVAGLVPGSGIFLMQVQAELNGNEGTFPAHASAETVGEFKTTPSVHAGYAATWFGLSGAGIYMTRKLITRGRG